jgi:hypothetical protein
VEGGALLTADEVEYDVTGLNFALLHGKPHRVRLVRAGCVTASPLVSPLEEGEYRVVILRHGIDMSGVPKNLIPSRPRQLLPYQPAC